MHSPVVLYLAVVMSGIADAIGGDHWQVESPRDADGGLVAPLFLALLVALQFDINISVTEDARELLDCLAARCFAAARERRSQRSLVTSGQADQARGILTQIVEGCRAIAFCGFAHFELRDELAQILVSLARFTKQRNSCGFGFVLVGEPATGRR